MFIKLVGFVLDPDIPDYAKDVIESKEEDYIWTYVLIRSEDVRFVYKKTNNKSVIVFYEDVPDMVVKENINSLLEKLEVSPSENE